MTDNKKKRLRWAIITGFVMILICLGIWVVLMLLTSSNPASQPGVMSRGLGILPAIFLATVLSVAAMYGKKGKNYWLSWLWVGFVNAIISGAFLLIFSTIEKLGMSGLIIGSFFAGYSIPALAENLQIKLEKFTSNLF